MQLVIITKPDKWYGSEMQTKTQLCDGTQGVWCFKVARRIPSGIFLTMRPLGISSPASLGAAEAAASAAAAAPPPRDCNTCARWSSLGADGAILAAEA
jgi:hypothetical protein